MMPVNFEGSNVTYKKPEGWTDDQCSDLHTLQQYDETLNSHTIISVWMPNKQDLDAMNAGRPLILQLVSSVMCPVSLWTQDENGNANV